MDDGGERFDCGACAREGEEEAVAEVLRSAAGTSQVRAAGTTLRSSVLCQLSHGIGGSPDTV